MLILQSMMLSKSTRYPQNFIKLVHTQLSHFSKDSTRMKNSSSGLSRIEHIPYDPMDLFKRWHDEATKFSPDKIDTLCLATVTQDLHVSARSMLFRGLDNQGFIVVTDSRSPKAEDIENTPRVAMCFLWDYFNEKLEHVLRQVRAEGEVTKLGREECEHLYNNEPLFSHIRSHICKSSHPVDWHDLKQKHDELLCQVRDSDHKLPMPDHYVAYKLQPIKLDFYHGVNQTIADRLLFTRCTPTQAWERNRVSA